MRKLHFIFTLILTEADDLGRIVVPKEIRRTLRIREGDPLLTTLIHNETDSEDDRLMELRQNIERIKRELFIEGIIGLTERTGRKLFDISR